MKLIVHPEPPPPKPVKTYDLLGLTELQFEAIVRLLGATTQGNEHGKAINAFFAELHFDYNILFDILDVETDDFNTITIKRKKYVPR